ncbi:branched-chain amino acid ABC transporter permease [Terasakiella pusilla]|jgi:branched-chain amino acid transport system permease protein|uniref:branched-chain amino acid ABC transporter permease n=1 Tax=Terasakiella pusilla TaxID=64973 RepID=UPI00048FB69C|nr:branched-chain amino acid ABC transporter permease [Terasakiella pusilla]
MDFTTILIQLLNSVQYGLLLFLISSGLTLVFGIMGVINLAHGAMYMIGAYLTYAFVDWTGSFGLALLLGLPVMLVVGIIIERFLIDHLYKKDHLFQVLLTFGLILILNDLQSLIWGNDTHGVPIPDLLSGSITLTDTMQYPIYRLSVSAICLVLAVAMYWVIQKTRLGMTIRAGASNREMVESLGINVRTLFTIIFAAGVALAGFGGMISAPLSSVYPGMGDSVLIICLVVVVIGGIGSIKGAFWGAMLVGLVSTFGPILIPSLASVMVYLVMAIVLLVKPRGLFA